MVKTVFILSARAFRFLTLSAGYYSKNNHLTIDSQIAIHPPVQLNLIITGPQTQSLKLIRSKKNAVNEFAKKHPLTDFYANCQIGLDFEMMEFLVGTVIV